MKEALILVDLQHDFCPGGALEVADGDQVIPVANAVQKHFDTIVATQDWHPPDHGSFASNNEGAHLGEVRELDGLPQVMWPDHCVQNTHGAELRDDLDTAKINRVFQKGTDPRIDSYSGFFDNGHRKATGMGDWLKEQGVTKVYVLGLATDYCVKYTALDARELGFETCLIVDGCRGVNLNEGDAAAAVEEMKAAGIDVIESRELGA